MPHAAGSPRSRTGDPHPVHDGAIELRIFYPRTAERLPAHLYIHGGGSIGGSIHDRLVDTLCRERCLGADRVLIAVNYRKAPEHRFPTGLNDCRTALRWVVEHADQLGIRADLGHRRGPVRRRTLPPLSPSRSATRAPARLPAPRGTWARPHPPHALIPTPRDQLRTHHRRPEENVSATSSPRLSKGPTRTRHRCWPPVGQE